MPDFINTEHCVEKLFPVGTTFSFEGKITPKKAKNSRMMLLF